MKLYDEYGDIIAKARGGLEKSTKDLADATRLSVAQLQAIEDYEVLPSRAESDRLAQQLALDADALWHAAEEAYDPVPPEDSRLIVRVLQVSAMESNAHVLYLPHIGKGLIVDAGGNAEGIARVAAQEKWPIGGVLITHGHSDHVGALAKLVEILSVPVLLHPAVSVQIEQDQLVPWQGEGEYLLGGVPITVLETPGHSTDSISFLIAGALFSGDTLFAGSLGRARSQRDYRKLLASGRRLLALPEDTGVFPGHGRPTTIGQERRFNPFVGGTNPHQC